MQEFLQQLINGLAVGGLYALIALGYTMVYGVLKLINFAHGELFALGAYLGLTLLTALGLAGGGPAAVALILLFAMGLVALAGYLLERVAYRPLRGSGRLTAVVSALGASIFFQNAMMLVFGAKARVYPGGILSGEVFTLLGAQIPATRILLLASSLLLMLLLYWFIHHTRTGAAVRAVSLDQGAARLMGIDVNRVISLVFLIGPALGAAAGVMAGLLYGQIKYDMGVLYGLKAFTAAILGGIGNIPGAMAGGILLGVIEALGAAYISIAWKDAIAFCLLILILIFRPTGLLGERTADKV
ncbi:MAG: branched-chain amino acid ABC transporter permease [Desulfovibrio sp.]|jgi:branched-chain amino acid transport system permease protein|nr:branched-chain amino acid ABC transporter permease [Desulfovibrio sp.]